MNIQDMTKLERNRTTCNWIPTYGFVTNLANSIGATKVCEVGVAYGYHAEYILDTIPNVHYQGVDPYITGYDPEDIFASDVTQLFNDEPQKAMDRLFAAVHAKMGYYNGRGNILRRTSVEGAAQFADGHFDLVYIDGDHTYEGVLKDLPAWYSKVRPGGILCGDDFNWPGVRQAVMEFMAEKGKEVIGYSSAGAAAPEKWSVII